jgi:hypothetical protein
MNEIIRKMRETVEAMDRASTPLSEEQRTWIDWWKRSLTSAILKAIKSGWVEGEL